MALPAILVSMITVTNTAASIIGTIKRRCGASQAIVELTSKCAELVVKIGKLLKTLEGSAEVPHDTRAIFTALNLRREEFDAILKNLDKMNRRTKRTHPVDRTEKFILAQGWAKKMESIHSDLANVRDGIETIVSSWDVGQYVVTKVVEEIVTVDVTKRAESGRRARRSGKHAKPEMMECGTINYVDQYLMTMVKLTDANKAALNRYGDLDNLSVPDALYRAWEHCRGIDESCYIQLLQCSAELHHPEANWWMGLYCKYGLHCKYGLFGVEQNLDLAVDYFRVASSHGDSLSTMQLLEHFDDENDKKSVVKYIKMASNIPLNWYDWCLCLQVTIRYGFESTQFMQPLTESTNSDHAFKQSICHFLGLGVPKSNQKALDALQSVNSDSYSVFILAENLNSYWIYDFYCLGYSISLDRTENLKATWIRDYSDFLFQSNQFLPLLLVSYNPEIYSSRKWKRCALHAARNRCIDAHFLLAQYYSHRAHPKKHEMKQHLRIAADAGHSHAQYVSRVVWGREASVSRGVRLEEEKRGENQDRERHWPRGKHYKRNEEDARKKRRARSSNEGEIGKS